LIDQLPRSDGITSTIGEVLMAPTVIYVKQVCFCLLLSTSHIYPHLRLLTKVV
jgi:phosphoribosylaminoimidazole (AIR) synthetase